MCKYLLFPFMQLFVPGDQDSATGTEQESLESSPQKTQIELWARAPGLLKQSVVIDFLGDECNLGIHYIEERNFRISITSLNKDHVLNQILLDMDFDEQSFELLFIPLNIEQGKKELKLENIEVVNKEFYYYIVEQGVKAYEDLLKSEFGNDI